jgi:perosamine synthetase
MPVHYGGCPCDIAALRDIADDHKLILIEDAAESFGADIKNRKVGTFGDSAMFSFCQNKIITTGEGGAIVTESRDLFEKMKLIRSHGRLETCDYFSTSAVMDYVALGYNFRMSTITAALGVAQIKKVEGIIEMRTRVADLYTSMFRVNVPVVSPMSSPKGYTNVHQLYSVRVPDRDGLMRFLTENGIMTKIYFPPVHLTNYYQHKLKYRVSLPITERVANDIVSLPIYPDMPVDNVKKVVQVISEYYGGNGMDTSTHCSNDKLYLC